MAGRINTSTQIRNFYSSGFSMLRLQFFNTNLSMSFSPYTGKSATGRSEYDTKNSTVTTVNWTSAFSIHKLAMDIVNGKQTGECSVTISCASDASLTLERKLNPAIQIPGQMETSITISKSGKNITFKFEVQLVKMKENGQEITKVIESGLGAFAKTIEGYLTGINADRHLDKMTEDYVKSLGDNANGGQQQNNQNYQRKQWKKTYSNDSGSQNNSVQVPKQSWEVQGHEQQDMSNYKVAD